MKSEIFTSIDEIDVYITNVAGRQIELSRLMLSLDIYENVFDVFLSGKLVVTDTMDILKNFLIVGNEEISISLHTTDTAKSVTLDFRVYKINRDQIVQQGDLKRKVMELFICSAEAIENGKSLVSKKFEGKPETVVSSVLSDHLGSSKDLDSDAGSSDITVYANYWRPAKIIDFVSRVSRTSAYSDYVFFENLDGFVFKPLSSLMSESAANDISFRTATDSFIGNTNIKRYNFSKYYNLLKSGREGLFGSTLYKPHDTEYSFEKVEATLAENFESITTNGSSFPFSGDMNSSENLVSTNFYEPSVSSVRMMSLLMLNNYNFSMRLNGDFSRKCGDVLNIEFPNLDNETSVNELFNGNWFVLGIRHTILQNNLFQQDVIVAKNSFFNKSELDTITALVNA
jgi:hypothetical protein